MSVRIRLQRFGRKKSAYFHIVVADSRSPRDGRFIERIGEYNPNANPAMINLNFDKALSWLEKGAQPSDTCRGILSYRGVMYRSHLNKGVLKGALTTEQAESKFNAWLEDKNARISKKSEGLTAGKEASRKAALEQEAKVNAERAQKIAARQSALSAEVENAETTSEEAPAAETTENTAE